MHLIAASTMFVNAALTSEPGCAFFQVAGRRAVGAMDEGGTGERLEEVVVASG